MFLYYILQILFCSALVTTCFKVVALYWPQLSMQHLATRVTSIWEHFTTSSAICLQSNKWPLVKSLQTWKVLVTWLKQTFSRCHYTGQMCPDQNLLSKAVHSKSASQPSWQILTSLPSGCSRIKPVKMVSSIRYLREEEASRSLSTILCQKILDATGE